MQFDWDAEASYESVLIFFAYMLALLIDSLLYPKYKRSLVGRIATLFFQLTWYTIFFIWYAIKFEYLIDDPNESIKLMFGYYLIIATPLIIVVYEIITSTAINLYNNFWQYLYRTKLKPDANLTMDDFRFIYYHYLKGELISKAHKLRNYILHSIYDALNFVTEYIPSDTLDDWRMSYGYWLNCQTLGRYLNYSAIKNKRKIIIQVESVDSNQNMIETTIHHVGLNSQALRKRIIPSLYMYSQIEPENIHIKTISPHRSKIFFVKADIDE